MEAIASRMEAIASDSALGFELSDLSGMSPVQSGACFKFLVLHVFSCRPL